jgi:cellulose synthase/poly-beta-1,6-N-acetylglucosamine synthase-like glycosyltransferase
MSPPLVTVVTSSWQRATTVVNHACTSVARQTYPNLQHIVVIDGNDPATETSLTEAGYGSGGTDMRRFVALGQNWSALAIEARYGGDTGALSGFGATARLTGSLLAAGELVAYLDDDNDYEPSHIAEMVQLFEEQPHIEFALSAGSCVPSSPFPAVGRADTSGIMHRTRLVMTHGGFDPRDGYEGDGKMLARWAAAGVPWAAKETSTFILHGYHHGAPLG